MAQRVVLHVGAMKSGTSYLQGLMVLNRDLLAERGLLVPGTVWRDQVSAVADVLGRTRVARAPEDGAWERMVREIEAWPGVAVISMEFLGPIGLPRIERVVSSFPEGTVDVVVTARDLNRQVPAMWQETLKNGRSFTFDDYVEAIRQPDGPPGKTFWREQTIAAMCRRWSDVVGIDHVTLVTVPRPGADAGELWRRFSAALGVDGAGIVEPPPANESLGAASVEVMRRLNVLVDDLEFAEYAPVVKHRLAKKVLARRRADEPPLGFDVPDWLPPLSARMVRRIGELGVRVVGDLDDLVPVPVPGVHPADVSDDERLDAAVAGLEGLVRVLVHREADGG